MDPLAAAKARKLAELRAKGPVRPTTAPAPAPKPTMMENYATLGRGIARGAKRMAGMDEPLDKSQDQSGYRKK